jgi:hypothetical protein
LRSFVAWSSCAHLRYFIASPEIAAKLEPAPMRRERLVVLLSEAHRLAHEDAIPLGGIAAVALSEPTDSLETCLVWRADDPSPAVAAFVAAARAAFGPVPGSAASTYAVSEAPDVGWTGEQTIALIAASVALIAAFVRIEARSVAPLVPLRIFRVLAAGIRPRLRGSHKRAALPPQGGGRR